jgi:hypothetical protein
VRRNLTNLQKTPLGLGEFRENRRKFFLNSLRTPPVPVLVRSRFAEHGERFSGLAPSSLQVPPTDSGSFGEKSASCSGAAAEQKLDRRKLT